MWNDVCESHYRKVAGEVREEMEMGINNLSNKELLEMAYDTQKIMNETIFSPYKAADRYGACRASVAIAALMTALGDYGEVHIDGNKC